MSVIEQLRLVYPTIGILGLLCLRLSYRPSQKAAFYLTAFTWFLISVLLFIRFFPFIVSDSIGITEYNVIAYSLGSVTSIACLGYFFSTEEWSKVVLSIVCGIALFHVALTLYPLAEIFLICLFSDSSFFDNNTGNGATFFLAISSLGIFGVSMIFALKRIDRWVILGDKKKK